MRRGERPLISLPRPLLLGFMLLLAFQVLHHHFSSLRFESDYQQLGKPFSATTYRGISMGSEQLAGYLLAIRLQLHDRQAGRSFS